MGRKRRQYISHSLYKRRTQPAYVRPLPPAAQRCLRLGSSWSNTRGDRRDSNPRPSESQFADTRFWALPKIAILV